MKLKPINPATEEILAELDISEKKDVTKIVKQAKEAFEEWKKTNISEREKIITNFYRNLARGKKEVSELITKEIGKPIIEAESEVDECIETTKWFVSETKKALQDEIVDVGSKDVNAKISFEPVGVVGIITPWNFPIGTVIWKIMPALLTANTIVFKPSELSTLCGLKIDGLLKESGLPEDVFNVVIGDGTTGQYLVQSDINMISFTGSTKVGKDVYLKAGKGIKKVALELGGSDPFIVFDDALFEQSVNAAVFGRFFNCGQVCTAAKRIFVSNKIYEKFIERFVKKVKKLKVGDPLSHDTEIGPLVSKKQLDVLENQVKDAIENGAKVLCGGQKMEREGYFYEPTVLTSIKNNMKVLNEEVFGPVASVMPFDSIKQVIELANKTNYGLGASVWTGNNKTAEAMSNSIQSGMVWINDFGTPYTQCPQGGIKESGIGRELSKYGILEFCNMKTIVNSKDKTIKKAWWFPYKSD